MTKQLNMPDLKANPHQIKSGDWDQFILLFPNRQFLISDFRKRSNIGTSHENSEFACDSIRHWWINYGSILYLLATSILLLGDGGGSNSSRSYLFKEALCKLSQE
jgi:hypothetical protein